MSSLLALLARPLIDAAASAFGHVLLDFMRAWKAQGDARTLGRAEAERDNAIATAEAVDKMNGVALPDDHELLRRLREGSA